MGGSGTSPEGGACTVRRASRAQGGRPGGSGGGAGSVPEQQHPLGARLPHQPRVLQHSGLLARVFLLFLVNAVRHYGFLVEHLQTVRVFTATFIHCFWVPVETAVL